MPDAACCGDRCNALRWPTQRAAFSIPRQGCTAGRLPLHPSLRLPAASSSLRESPVSVFMSCGPVPSAARGISFCCVGLSCSLVRVCAFCCAVQSSLLCGSVHFLACSVHSLEKTNGVADVGCRSGNGVGMGLWSLWLRAGASRLAGSGKSTGALKKEAQQAGLTQPLRLLVRRDRDSNPGYSHPYAAFRVRSIRPLWHLSSSGSAALPVPCARGWWWRPWSNPFRSAKLLQPFHSNKHWSEKASPGQGVFIFRADGLCSLSRGFLSFRQGSQAFRAGCFSYSDRSLRLSEQGAFPIQTEVSGFPS